jgi:hypothetical protein
MRWPGKAARMEEMMHAEFWSENLEGGKYFEDPGLEVG